MTSKFRAETFAALARAGFSAQEAQQLARASATLHTWAEHECNGAIQRDEETGVPYWHSTHDGRRLSRTSDRERGALATAQRIAEAHGMSAYHQGDPRGCCLWIIRPGDVPRGGEADAYYSRGLAVVP